MDISLYSSALYVDMNILKENMHILSQRHKCVIPVLKSDAYGLGLVPVARILEKSPAVRMVAVAQVLEGAALREAGIKTEILVLGGTLPRQWPAAAELDLTLAVTRPGMVTELDALGKPIQVHLKIETGLNRTGVRPGAELAGVIEELKQSSYVNLTGTYSHFADAEARNRGRCQEQLERYRQAGEIFPDMLLKLIAHLQYNAPLGEKFDPIFG